MERKHIVAALFMGFLVGLLFSYILYRAWQKIQSCHDELGYPCEYLQEP